MSNRPDWLLDHTHDMPLETVAKSLARINRFSGRTPKPYSVAKHSVVVMHLLPRDASFEARRLALAHDWHEIYVGDVCRPAKQRFGAALRELTDEIDLVMWDRYQLSPTLEDRQAVDAADNLANRIEVELLGYSGTARVEFALKQMDLPNGCKIDAIAKHMTYLTTADRDANLWLWWWVEITSDAAKARLAT